MTAVTLMKHPSGFTHTHTHTHKHTHTQVCTYTIRVQPTPEMCYRTSTHNSTLRSTRHISPSAILKPSISAGSSAGSSETNHWNSRLSNQVSVESQPQLPSSAMLRGAEGSCSMPRGLFLTGLSQKRCTAIKVTDWPGL